MTGSSSDTIERTADGRHIVVGGRKWRATDPGIPPKLAAELRSALMAARRGVGAAMRTGADLAAHRARVNDAKLALGERGRAWWDPPTDDALRIRIAASIRTLADARAPKTTCPSDTARVVGGDHWRALMPTVRDVAEQMASDKELVVMQRGEPVQPPWKGPIRFRRP